MELKFKPISFYSCFNLLNVLQPISPGETHTYWVSFEPNLIQSYKETLFIYDNYEVSLDLVGEVTDPKIEILEGKQKILFDDL